ncbi:MAG: FtsW/RodA/SpoVE family cell cycle protein [Candidatus Saccharimonadales bacterium]
MERVRRTTVAAKELVRKHRPDYRLVGYAAILVMIGLIIIFAIGPQRANVLNESFGSSLSDSYFIIKQATSVILAIVTFFVFAYIFKFDFLLRHSTKILLVGFGASALLALFGNVLGVEAITQCALGACRWFVIPGIGTLQPAEILKFGMLIFLAGFLAARMRSGEINDKEKTIIPLAILLGICAFFVIILQKDLGTGVALVSIVIAMMTVAGINGRLGIALLGILLLGAVLTVVMAPHRMARMTTFFQGDEVSIDDPGSYHIAHAKIAIGSGGFLGLGIGNSVQAAGYLPEAINDSVFAILGETFGFVGLVFILAMFYLLLRRVLKVMDHLIDDRYKLLVAGVFGWIGSHVIINIAAMIGLMPLTGITLPLLSFGGTSMVFIAAILGLVFQASQYTVHRSELKKETKSEDSRSRRRVGRTRYASRRSI